MARTFAIFTSPSGIRGVYALHRKHYSIDQMLAWTDGARYFATEDDAAINRVVADLGIKGHLYSTTLRTLNEEQKALLEWAKATSESGEKPIRSKTLQGQEFDRRVVPYSDPTMASVLGTVGYDGWASMQKRSSHSLQDLQGAIERAVALTWRTWPGWLPTGLLFKFHTHEREMGLAIGTGRMFRESGVRLISLNERLLQNYDTNSIYRVVLHELAHHYREEAYPKSYDAHDAIFCQILSSVDPLVSANPVSCRHFVDDVNQELAEQVAEKKAKARGGVPEWSPTSGFLELEHLKSGRYSFRWKPRPGHRFATITDHASDEAFVELLRHFSPIQWAQVSVVLTPRVERISAFRSVTTLLELVLVFARGYRSIMPKTIALLQQNGIAV